MKVYFNQITEEGKILEFSERDLWLLESISALDESKSSSSRLTPQGSSVRPIFTRLELRRVDEVFVVDGTLRTAVELLCSRCATPYVHEIKPKFSQLYSKDPLLAGVAENNVHHHYSTKDGHVPSESDVEIALIREEFLELSDLITEQVQVVIPLAPLCKTECKGICQNCGADLNAGRCACSKIASNNPFSVLKDFKKTQE